jgi:hypothetical protein
VESLDHGEISHDTFVLCIILGYWDALPFQIPHKGSIVLRLFIPMEIQDEVTVRQRSTNTRLWLKEECQKKERNSHRRLFQEIHIQKFNDIPILRNERFAHLAEDSE